ncbi:MAG: cation transporter, partial [Candidatus Firestonebacteria bacterium]
MNIKQKASITAVGLNITLTVLKFIMFFFTGGLAILSEAWHSLTDITASSLVFISLRPQTKTREIKLSAAGSGVKSKKMILKDI